jgi:hypothetical protein
LTFQSFQRQLSRLRHVRGMFDGLVARRIKSARLKRARWFNSC